MVITTKNSVYTLEDKGDGAFTVRSTNLAYAGPWLSRMERGLRIGEHMIYTPLEGPVKGRAVITSPIIGIEA